MGLDAADEYAGAFEGAEVFHDEIDGGAEFGFFDAPGGIGHGGGNFIDGAPESPGIMLGEEKGEIEDAGGLEDDGGVGGDSVAFVDGGHQLLLKVDDEEGGFFRTKSGDGHIQHDTSARNEAGRSGIATIGVQHPPNFFSPLF